EPSVQAEGQVVPAYRLLGDDRVRRGGAAGQAADRLDHRTDQWTRALTGVAPRRTPVRQADHAGSHGEDVGTRADLAGLDAVRGEQSRGGDVQGAGEVNDDRHGAPEALVL